MIQLQTRFGGTSIKFIMSLAIRSLLAQLKQHLINQRYNYFLLVSL